MSVATPLLDNTIEADEPEFISGNINTNGAKKSNGRAPVVLTPTTRSPGSNGPAMASNDADAEGGKCFCFRYCRLELVWLRYHALCCT
jgi:hypothetical protein